MFLLDSLLPSPEFPASLQIQLTQIYGSSDDQLLIEVPHLSKQDRDDSGWKKCFVRWGIRRV